jgi:hypothetical protein
MDYMWNKKLCVKREGVILIYGPAVTVTTEEVHKWAAISLSLLTLLMPPVQLCRAALSQLAQSGWSMYRTNYDITEV